MAKRRAPGESRSALMEAGFEAIATLGWSEATTAEICRRAGVSSGTFFHYFPTKEDLLVALLEDDRSAPEFDSLEALLDDVVDEIEHPLAPWFAVEVAALSRVPRVREALEHDQARQREAVRNVLKKERARGAAGDIELDEQVAAVCVLIEGYQSLRAAHGPGADTLDRRFLHALVRKMLG